MGDNTQRVKHADKTTQTSCAAGTDWTKYSRRRFAGKKKHKNHQQQLTTKINKTPYQQLITVNIIQQTLHITTSS